MFNDSVIKQDAIAKLIISLDAGLTLDFLCILIIVNSA